MAILERNDTLAVARLQMNAPERLNALSDEMIHALQTQLDQIATDPNIRVVILSGAGKAFCAGHDLKQMTAGRQAKDAGRTYFADLFARCAKLMLTIQSIPQPVIAQVHGIATAAGCQLVATCDLAVATDTTKFGVNGVNIGLFCSTPMVALSRNVSRKHAMEMLLTGDMINTDRALDFGLINQVVPVDKLTETVMKLAEKIASKSSLTVSIGKEAFYEQAEMSIDDAYAYASEVMVKNMLARDAEEGIGAFFEKRTPQWEGR